MSLAVEHGKLYLSIRAISEADEKDGSRTVANGSTNLVLTRREDRIIALSLLEALEGWAGNEPEFVRSTGLSVGEARSLGEELSILHRRLFGLPEFQSQRDRDTYFAHAPSRPRSTGTVCPKCKRNVYPTVGYLIFWLAGILVSSLAR